MTNDLYGSEAHDHEDVADAAPAENHVHEAPSDFEFNDPAEHVILENENDPQAALSSETQAKPRSPILPIAAAAGGILLLGGVALWQFGGSSAPPPMPMVSTMPSLATAPTDTAAAVAPRMAENPASNSTTAPTSSASAPDMAASPAPASGASAPVEPVTASIPPPSASSMTAPGVASSDPTDTRLAALSARLDILQKELDQSNQQLAQITNVIAASASESTSGKDLQDRLDKIEQELRMLNTKPVRASAPMAANPKTAMISRTPSQRKAMTHKAALKTVEKPVAEAQWVLRAASPGEAWVASSATSGDLKALHVGDSLASIGRVTSIEPKDGGWIVRGTAGSIQ